MGPFDDIHNTLLNSFQLYGNKRGALTDTLQAEMHGNVGAVALTPAQVQRIAPKAAELNVLIEGILARSNQDSREAWKLLGTLRNSLNKEFSLKLNIELKPKFEPQPNNNPSTPAESKQA